MTKENLNTVRKTSAAEMTSKLLAEFSDDCKKEILPDDELLISWLDGDLNENDRLLFEKKLKESPDLRQKSEELRETWDMLDSLKTDPASPKLANSTMEMAALYAQRECRQRLRRIFHKRLFFLAGIVLLLIVTLFSARLITQLFLDRSAAQIEQMTPFLIRLDQMETIESFDFLVALADSGLFKDSRSSRPAQKQINVINPTKPDLSPSSTADQTLPSSADRTSSFSVPSADRAHESVKTPSNESIGSTPQKTESGSIKTGISSDSDNSQNYWSDPDFQRLVIKYHRLSRSHKKDLTNLYRKIELSPRKTELLKTAENYYNWLTGELREWQRDSIIYAPDKERMTRIKKCINEIENAPTRSNGSVGSVSLPPAKRSFPLEFHNDWRGQSGQNILPNQGRFSAGPDPSSERPQREFYHSLNSPNKPDFLKDNFNGPNEYRRNRERDWDSVGLENGQKQTGRQNSVMPPFFGKNSSVWNNLPEELRKEDLSSLYSVFDQYIEERKKKAAQATKTAEPSGSPSFNSGRAPYRGGFRVLINDFIESRPMDVFLKELNPSARSYIEKLPEQERKKVIGLLFSFNLCSRRGPEFSSPNNNHFNHQKRYYPEMTHPVPFENDFSRNGFFWMNESTGELAETLRKLPQEKQDELLSLPSDEMYAQLLILHWGFDPKKVRKPQ